MLNTKEINIKHTTNCLKDRNFMFIARPADNAGIQVVIMPITEEEENDLNNNRHLVHKYLGNEFYIDPSLCYAYGELDLSPNSKDIKKIYDANWFDKLDVNIIVYSEYNYETHTVTSDVKGGRWYETDDPRIYLPYFHACLNKPKRVVIFKDPYSVAQKLRLSLSKHRKVSQAKKTKEEIASRNAEKQAEKRQVKISKLNFTVK